MKVEEQEGRQGKFAWVICIVLFVGLALVISYEYFSYVSAHVNGQPIFFKNEVASLGENNTPILFIGQYRGDIGQYLNESSAYGTFNKAIGITYITDGPTVRCENLYVTYWRLVKNEKGVVKAARRATIEYKKDFYFIQGVTAEGIFFIKMGFWNSDLPVASEIMGFVAGLFVSALIVPKIRKYHREMVA